MPYRMRKADTNLTPVRVIPETEIIKSSNTWEYLLFEQMRGIRFIQLTLFTEPDWVKHKLYNFIVAVNHLETLCNEKFDPTGSQNSDQWAEYMRKKPDLFKNFGSDKIKLVKIDKMSSGDAIDQLELCAWLEKWIRALDRYMASMKKIDVEAFDMKVSEEELIPAKD